MTSDKIYCVNYVESTQCVCKKKDGIETMSKPKLQDDAPVGAILDLYYDGWISSEISKLLHLHEDDVLAVINAEESDTVYG